MSDPATPWEQLFPQPSGAERAVTLRFRLVRKHGHPLLLVPASRATVGEAVGLYPAQTSVARIARWLLGVCLRAGFAPGTQEVGLRMDPGSAFVRFLFPSGVSAADPGFALLCGNPNAPGRRLILLVFDRRGRPQKLVKAGIGGPARALIQSEAAFLKSQASDRLHAPALTGEFSAENLEAMALQYAAGQSPDPRDLDPLAKLLTAWIDPESVACVADLPAWRRLAAAAQSNPLFPRLQSVLGGVKLHPAVYHGDLAPWNIRVDPETRRWTVLDWERGEPAGPPGWDWFHFVIQPEILVRRAGTEAVVARIEELLRSDVFVDYARRAGMEDIARGLVMAYLLYCAEVIAPAEGRQATNDLLNALDQRWPHA